MPAAAALREHRRRPVVVGIAVVAVAALGIGAWAVLGRSSGSGIDDGTLFTTDSDRPGPASPTSPASGREIASGVLPTGTKWTLMSHPGEGGQLCYGLVLPGRSARDNCESVPEARAFGTIRASVLAPPSADTPSIIYGIVSTRTSQVRAAAEDGTDLQVAMAREPDSNVRFFVVFVPRPVATTLRASTADGAEIGRAQLPPFTGRPPG